MSWDRSFRQCLEFTVQHAAHHTSALWKVSGSDGRRPDVFESQILATDVSKRLGRCHVFGCRATESLAQDSFYYIRINSGRVEFEAFCTGLWKKRRVVYVSLWARGLRRLRNVWGGRGLGGITGGSSKQAPVFFFFFSTPDWTRGPGSTWPRGPARQARIWKPARATVWIPPVPILYRHRIKCTALVPWNLFVSVTMCSE